MIAWACQGFLTSEGQFVNRVQAKPTAYIASSSNGGLPVSSMTGISPPKTYGSRVT